MKRIYVDFETYWDIDYTLSKMVTIDYILDPRYETIGCGVTIDSDKPFWLPRDQIREYLEAETEPYMCISHNALFDASILAYRYCIHPTLIIDTMGMARAILMAELPQGRVALKKVAKFLDIGTKGETVLKTKGMTRKELESKPFLYKEYVSYCKNDVDLCRRIYLKLKNRFPATEHIIMDHVIKTTTQPQLQLNIEHLKQHLAGVQLEKANLLRKIKFTVDDLMSNPKFAIALKSMGVQPPIKISPSTGQLTWAFAKADVQFMELLEHPDPDVQALMAARLGHKSTLEETRTERFISIARSTKGYWDDTYIPMALRYAGAHTHRLSGDWGLNLQNLPSRKSTMLRQSITAPAGTVILAVDAAQIEARLVAWFARQYDLLKAFEDRNRDVYKEFACVIFHTVLDKVTKIQRFVAKECILGLGFQLGKVKLLNTLITKAKDQGIEIEIPFTLELTQKWVDTYRNRYYNIRQYWNQLRDYLPVISGIPTSMKIRDCCIVKHQKIRLPNGLYLYYNDLHLNDEGEWWFTYGGRQKKLYGGKLLENLVQTFDRMIVMDAALRVFQRTGYRMVHQVHDELLYIVSENEVDDLKTVVLEEMERRPAYALDLPLKAEAKIGYNYGILENNF